VDFPLETPTHGGIERPGEIGGSEEENTRVIVPDTVDLNHEFGLHAGGVLVCTGAVTVATEGVELVNEDDGGFVLARHLK